MDVSHHQDAARAQLLLTHEAMDDPGQQQVGTLQRQVTGYKKPYPKKALNQNDSPKDHRGGRI
jgi:hypothetical protein